MFVMEGSKICRFSLCFLYILCAKYVNSEVVYLCFEEPKASAQLSCPKETKIKIVESLYVKSQWDACFYQYGAGDCAQKTEIGFNCCGLNKCDVKASKAYLPACGFSTLLRLVYECIPDAVPLPCEEESASSKDLQSHDVEGIQNNGHIKGPGRMKHRRPHIKTIVSTNTENSNVDHRQKHVRHYSPRPDISQPGRIRHQKDRLERKESDNLTKPRLRARRPRKKGSKSKNSTAYGLLGSGIIIILILSSILAFLWWRRKKEEKRANVTSARNNITIEHPNPKLDVETAQQTIPNSNIGLPNKGYDNENIMVSVLPEAPPRRKRKRRFPSFLGVKEIRALKLQPTGDSLQDYDGESLSDSGIEVPGGSRNKCLTRPQTDMRPEDYSGDIERLQQNFVTREARVKPTTEI